jgi:hypothetical protein
MDLHMSSVIWISVRFKASIVVTIYSVVFCFIAVVLVVSNSEDH